MPKVTNVQVFGLDESIYRSGYPMMRQAPSMEEFYLNVKYIQDARLDKHYEIPAIARAIKLAQLKEGGHDQFLTGITVTADITLSNKCWVEAERYTFLNFISSMSTMHRLSSMGIRDCCNEFVRSQMISEVEELQKVYNNIDEHDHPTWKKRAYLELLYNLPSGFELMAGMITNYRCLKNIYRQRRNHRLPDWHVFCDWIETLPMANELIIGKKVEPTE